MINFQSVTTFQGKSLRSNYSCTVLDSILKICFIWNSHLNFLICVICDVGTSCHVLCQTMSRKRWAFGHWGKKGGRCLSFSQTNCKRNILIGWEHLYVNQMSWLSLKGTTDWKIRTRKTIFSNHQKFSILCDAIHFEFFTALLRWKSETLKTFGSGITLCRENFKTKW